MIMRRDGLRRDISDVELASTYFLYSVRNQSIKANDTLFIFEHMEVSLEIVAHNYLAELIPMLGQYRGTIPTEVAQT
jgi:hypothetical protein